MTKIRLKEISTRAPKEFDKSNTKEKTAAILEELDELQNLLYAEHKHAVLIVLQGMDASGKDGVIRDVLGNMNPQGVTVRSFKAPTEEELSHDFLWRIHHHAPQKGMIQVFNRSHYEDILVTRVHQWCDDNQAKKRMKAINDFEELLQDHNSTHILKFYLHISPEEQHQRLSERMEDPAKMWKYNERDFEEAKLWDDTWKCMRIVLTIATSRRGPSFLLTRTGIKNIIVASTLRDKLKSLNMQYPALKKQKG